MSLIGALAGLATGIGLFSLLCVANFVFQSGAPGGDDHNRWRRRFLSMTLPGSS